MAGAEGKDKGGEEAPAAAAEEFVKTFVESVGKPEPEGDPNVSVSFALGWHMSDLYRATSWPGTKPGQNDGDLPGMSELSARERAKVGLDQIDVGLAHLSATIKAADLEVPSTDGSRKALEKGTEDDAEHKAFRSQIFALHLELLGKLTAVSFKIGKAYGLGRALADTTYEPTDIRTLQRELEEHRVANLLAWLSDLTSLFPAHAGHSVRDSLEKWRDWAKPPSLNLNKREPGEVVRLLRRQGQHWRALLSGEKRATDMLEQQDYIFAASKTLGQLGALTWRFALKFWYLVLAIAALLAASILFVVEDPNSSAHVAAGIGGLLASLGLTWKGIGGSLGKAASKLERPVWEAALDMQIAEAMTLTPVSKVGKSYSPPELRR